MAPRHQYTLGLFLLIIGGGLLFVMFRTSLPSLIRLKAWQARGKIVTMFPWNTTIDQSQEERIKNLENENTVLKSERHIFSFMQNQLALSDPFSANAIPSLVIGRPIDTFHSQLLLNKGSRDNIKVGAPVMIHGSTLLGIITDVSETVSTCTLLLNPNTALSAGIILDEGTPIAGLVQGKQYTSVILTTVPKDKPLVVDQTVVSLSKNENIPPGLLIGTIDRIETTTDDVYQEAILKLPYDFDDIYAVTVLAL